MNGEQYRKLREASGYTQPALAEKLGVSVDTIGRRESGTAVINAEAGIAIKALCMDSPVPPKERAKALGITVKLPKEVEKQFVNITVEHPKIERKPLFGGLLRAPKKGESGK